MKVKLKVCCISSVSEAKMAIDAGANVLGLVGPMPSGPGVVSDDVIQTVCRMVPPGVESFLLTSSTVPEEIIDQQRRLRPSCLQLVDAQAPTTYRILREALPGIRLIQVIHVIDESSVTEALGVASQVDALLLDSGNPNLAIKELGGTGRTHDWELSRKICRRIHKPVFLAGGLNGDNVRDAVRIVQPYGVDICSGLRTAGALDSDKLETFANKLVK